MTKTLCLINSDCDESDVTGQTCNDAACAGTTTCTQFTKEGAGATIGCVNYTGCSWDDGTCGTSFIYKEACELGGCDWTCTSIMTEYCGNNVDDNSVVGADCDDTGCQVTGSITDAQARGTYNCLGTSKTGDVDYGAGEYYCGQGIDAVTTNPVPGVGLCCESGNYPLRSPVGTWSCVPSDPCRGPGDDECGVDYSTATFSQWLSNTFCLDPGAPLACCSVVQFGSEEYWSDSDNIRVY